MKKELMERMELLHYVSEHGAVLFREGDGDYQAGELGVGDYESAYRDLGPEGEAMFCACEEYGEAAFTFGDIAEGVITDNGMKINGMSIVFLMPKTVSDILTEMNR